MKDLDEVVEVEVWLVEWRKPPKDPLVDVSRSYANMSVQASRLLKKGLQAVLCDLATGCNVNFSEANHQLIVGLRY